MHVVEGSGISTVLEKRSYPMFIFAFRPYFVMHSNNSYERIHLETLKYKG